MDINRPLLFNLRTDIGERDEVIAAKPEVARRLHALLEAWTREMDGAAESK